MEFVSNGIFFGGSDNQFQLLFYRQQRRVQNQIVVFIIGHRNVVQRLVTLVFQTPALHQVFHGFFLGRIAFLFRHPVEKDSVGGDVGRHQQMYLEGALYEMPCHSGIEYDVLAAHLFCVLYQARIDDLVVMMILLAPFVQFQRRYSQLRSEFALNAPRVKDLESVFRIQPFTQLAFPRTQLPVDRYKHYSSPSNKSPTTESTSAISSASATSSAEASVPS